MIRGYVSMLGEGAFGELPSPYNEEILPILEGKLTSMDLLVEQTLEASRLEDSRLLLKKERTDFGQIATNAIETTRPLAGRHHQLSLSVPPAPLYVDADADRLTTILTNLIDNAIKYSPEGGEVTAQLSTAGAIALLSVRDEGIGIAAEDMGRLFVRFSRLDQLSDVPGTGLGLYLARELARLHGGDIVARSKFGEGSEFTLSLPLGAARK